MFCRLVLYCGLAAGWSCGCAQVLEIPEDPGVVDDGPWHCLDGDLSASTTPPTTTAMVRVYVCSFLNGCVTPIIGLTAEVCGKRDVECVNPLTTGVQDNDGFLEFEIQTGPSGFDGYLRVTAPLWDCFDEEVFGEDATYLCDLLPDCDPEEPEDGGCAFPTYATTMLFFNPPIRTDIDEPLLLPIVSSRGLPAVLDAAGIVPEPTKGAVLVTALDCDGKPASGVRYSIKRHQDEVTQFYVDSGSISTGVEQTDESGMGAFIGVPAGFAEIAGHTEDQVLVGDVGILAAPNAMTYVTLVPSP